MKRWILCFLLLACSHTPKQETRVEPPSNSALRPYREVTLDNGLKIIFIEDGKLPYVSFQMVFETGSSSDPVSKSGLSSLLISLLDKGTNRKTAGEIADAIGYFGADYSAMVEHDYTHIGLSGLSIHRSDLLNLLSEVILYPAYKEAEIQRAKQQVIARIRQTADDPESFSDRLFSIYSYGSHPYANSSLGLIRDIRSIRRKHVIKQYLALCNPANAVLSVVGRIDDKFIDEVKATFANWRQKERVEQAFPQIPAVDGIQIRLVHKMDSGQAQIKMGNRGIRRTDPDYLNLKVASFVIGQGFTSRLVDRIRDTLGLTYHISASFDYGRDYGLFSVDTFTRNEKVGQMIAETIKTLDAARTAGVTKEEVELAKGYIKGAFPQIVETSERLAMNLSLLRTFGIPDSYLLNFVDNIDGISVDDVNKAIERHLDPKNIRILIYGDKNKILPQIRPIGMVEVRDFIEFIN